MNDVKSKNTWFDMFKLAVMYKNYHGNLFIEPSFKTINGYEYDPNGLNLSKWLTVQRHNYYRLDNEKKLLLKSIDFIADIGDYKWMMMYNLAKNYYEYHGDLLVSKNFKTKNGYEEDEDGKNLGVWLDRQRKILKNLKEERIILLDEIDMIWDYYENKIDILNICKEYNINSEDFFKKNAQVLELKLKYLTDNNLPIIDSNGVLNEIINMDNITMKDEYGISVKYLKEKYNSCKIKKMER